MASLPDIPTLNSSLVERPSDFGSAPEDQVAYWLSQDKAAEKLERKWVRQGRKIVKRYRDDRSGAATEGHKYNILWSNVQTLRPALYNQTPKPDIERRFRDSDDVGRAASMIMERVIANSLDQSDFNSQMAASVDDYLLPGRGVMRVMYVPHYGEPIPPEGEDEDGEIDTPEDDAEEPEQTEQWGASSIVANDGDGGKVSQKDKDEDLREVVSESALLKYVFWEDYREGPARRWQEVPWIRYRAYMTRDELVDRFGPKGKLVQLDTSVSYDTLGTNRNGSDDKSDPLLSVLKKAEVWEIWDKARLRVVWLAPGSSELGLLDQVDDPLELPGFYPSPNPLLSTTTTDTRIPVPDYHEYQDQAIELDVLTARIDRLIRAVKVSGVYPGSEKQVLQQLIDESSENKLFPVEDWNAFMGDKGGLDKIIQWMPIQEIAETLIQLFAARDRTKQTLYEITGMSDIMRGATDPTETATAQTIKSQYGQLRLNDRQREVARYARDCIRLVAFTIANHFSPQTISLMSGYPQLQPIAPFSGQQLAMDPQTGQPSPSPEYQQWMAQYGPVIQKNQAAQSEFSQALELIKNEIELGFRIDIEADSTIAADEQSQQEQATQFMQGLLPLLQQAIPLAQGSPPMAKLAKELVLFSVRRFRAGRPVEQAIEEAFDQLAETPPPPPPGVAAKPAPDPAIGQAKMLEAQGKTQTAQQANEIAREKNQQQFVLGQQKNQITASNNAQNIEIKQQKLESDQALDTAHLINAQSNEARALT